MCQQFRQSKIRQFHIFINFITYLMWMHLAKLLTILLLTSFHLYRQANEQRISVFLSLNRVVFGDRKSPPNFVILTTKTDTQPFVCVCDEWWTWPSPHGINVILDECIYLHGGFSSDWSRLSWVDHYECIKWEFLWETGSKSRETILFLMLHCCSAQSRWSKLTNRNKNKQTNRIHTTYIERCDRNMKHTRS